MSETPALPAASTGAEPVLPAQPAAELPETPPQRAVRKLKKRAAAKKAKKSAIDSNAETPKRRRKRGGQPGNTNAVSHGFYARRLPETELDGLDQTGVSSLKDEIDVMRVFSRKVAELGAEVDDLDEAKSLLNTLSVATGSINRLVRTHSRIPDPTTDPANLLRQALIELEEEWPELKAFGDQFRDKPSTKSPPQ